MFRNYEPSENESLEWGSKSVVWMNKGVCDAAMGKIHVGHFYPYYVTSLYNKKRFVICLELNFSEYVVIFSRNVNKVLSHYYRFC